MERGMVLDVGRDALPSQRVHVGGYSGRERERGREKERERE